MADTILSEKSVTYPTTEPSTHSREARSPDLTSGPAGAQAPLTAQSPDLAASPADLDPSTTASPQGSSISQKLKHGLRHRVLHLTPSWFSAVMGTGIASVLLHNFPYPAQALRDIGVVVFVLNVVLACTLLLMSIARYITWPKIFMLMLEHPVQSLFLGTFPMGWTTIINMIVFVCVPRWGQPFVHLAHILWWIDTAITLVICIGVPFVMFTRHQHAVSGLSAIWLLPIVTCIVMAASGGVVATVLDPIDARLVLITSYVLWGFGVPLAIIIMSPYFLRLAVHKVPPPETIVSVFLPVGPCGQGAYGLLQLSSVLRKLAILDGVQLVYGSATAGTIDPADARTIANAIYGVSVLGALVLWGLGLFWLVMAVGTVVDMACKGGFPFNMGWWGFTFPIGVFALASNALATELDSTPFKVIGATLSASVVLLWLVVASGTTYHAFTGTIFVAPCLGPLGGNPPETGSSRPQPRV